VKPETLLSYRLGICYARANHLKGSEMQDPFDFSAFVEKASNPDDETRREMLRDAVSDEMGSAMGEVAPRIWSILQDQMKKDPQNNIHLNAVINAAIFAILGWAAACTPKGETNSLDNDEVLRDKIMKNADNALANARDQGGEMALIASNIGRLKLLQDANENLAQIITSNSMIIQGIHKTIQNMGKPPA